MPGTSRRGFLLGALAAPLFTLALLLPTKPARAYLCARVSNIYQVPSGPSLAWSPGGRTIHYSIHYGANGPTTQLDPDAAVATVRRAFAAWTHPLVLTGGEDVSQCGAPIPPTPAIDTDIQFVYDGPADQTFVGYNYLAGPTGNRNMVIFRDDFWPYENTVHAKAIALTTDTVDTQSGTIFDSDIEINTRRVRFYAGDGDPGEGETDLLNTLVHEVGHVLGLGHSEEPEAVMYRQAEAQETKKRALSCDDAKILAFRYPSGAETGYCGPKNSAQTCGDCAAPGALTSDVKVRLAAHDDGLGGQGCRSAGAPLAPGGLALLAWAAAGLAGGRGRQRPCRAGSPPWPGAPHLVKPGVHEPQTRRDR